MTDHRVRQFLADCFADEVGFDADRLGFKKDRSWPVVPVRVHPRELTDAAIAQTANFPFTRVGAISATGHLLSLVCSEADAAHDRSQG